MKNKMAFQLTLGFSDPIKNKEEIAQNVTNGILNQAMDFGITHEDEEGSTTDIMLFSSSGEPLANAQIGLYGHNLTKISHLSEKQAAGYIQREALRQVSHGLATIAGQMDNDDQFRKWIENTSFFSFFTGCIDEISRRMMHIIPVNDSIENESEINTGGFSEGGDSEAGVNFSHTN